MEIPVKACPALASKVVVSFPQPPPPRDISKASFPPPPPKIGQTVASFKTPPPDRVWEETAELVSAISVGQPPLPPPQHPPQVSQEQPMASAPAVSGAAPADGQADQASPPPEASPQPNPWSDYRPGVASSHPAVHPSAITRAPPGQLPLFGAGGGGGAQYGQQCLSGQRQGSGQQVWVEARSPMDQPSGFKLVVGDLEDSPLQVASALVLKKPVLGPVV